MQPYTPAMRFDNGGADRKTEPKAVLLRGRERIEQTVRKLGIDARPVVENADLDPRRRRMKTRDHPDVTVLLSRRRDRLDGVMHEIEHHLLELHMIAVQRR